MAAGCGHQQLWRDNDKWGWQEVKLVIESYSLSRDSIKRFTVFLYSHHMCKWSNHTCFVVYACVCLFVRTHRFFVFFRSWRFLSSVSWKNRITVRLCSFSEDLTFLLSLSVSGYTLHNTQADFCPYLLLTIEANKDLIVRCLQIISHPILL